MITKQSLKFDSFPSQCPASISPTRRRQKAFTLLELLVVIAIIALMATGTSYVFQGQGQSVNRAASQLSDMVNNARIYAIANQSYVWLALYQDNASGGVWMVLATTGKTQAVGTEGIKLIRKGVFLQGITLKNRNDLADVAFSGSPAPTTPGETPDAIATSGGPGAFNALQMTIGGKSIAFDRLVVFTPRGEAITQQDSSQNPVYSRWIEVGLANQHGSTKNSALLQFGGISSQCTTYRP